jgi:GT2 family glycosyltransferase
MKILVAVPTYESIQPETFKSIYGLDKCGHNVVFDFQRGYDCATARNNIAKEAIAEEADYVLMVDNDVILPSDTLRNLLETQTDVCLGYYLTRWGNQSDSRVVIFKDGEYNYSTYYNRDELQALRNKGVFREKVHGGGFGCALVRTDVFKRIAFPWFKFTIYEDGSNLGEDLNFCERCKEAGIPIIVDTRVSCKHLVRKFME